jgi:hypothetical protein
MKFGVRMAAVRRRALRVLRLALALIVAGVASWRDPADATRKIMAAFRSWTLMRGTAPRHVIMRRYKSCLSCPIFYKPLKTCGSPLSAELRGLGCYCSMETKVLYEGATCWLNDNVGGRFTRRGWLD